MTDPPRQYGEWYWVWNGRYLDCGLLQAGKIYPDGSSGRDSFQFGRESIDVGVGVDAFTHFMLITAPALPQGEY